MTAGPAPAPAGRADARRNREIVLRTAMRVFAEEGLEISLGRIAQRAGVGAGTVYRHFPSKEILIEAVLAEHIEGLVAAADGWAARAAPGDALFGFLLEVIEKSAGRQHICDALTADRGWPRVVMAAAGRRFREALERLLRDAKEAGAIRADVRADDLSALAVGGAALRSAHRDPVRGTLLVRLLLDGLRPGAVTKYDAFRDSSSLPRHGTAAERHCVECGARLRVRATGRPPRYCGPACRQRAHRRRLAVQPPSQS
ncbi:TetR/AcrR family transcriptional regulator [Actinoallomurus rhizosphaericola]|uniref:TetR/AcrR family transcriptional regulator n=1 Tax=Actinoallomurus rhizosphaericola TaxID=2952536 RepID=UPI002091FEB0|nr:TetR/AcrR family transcriptional regulator [Actinoallomurus rhizosphaericola]MCO5996803.1 TetR/AcrR family transcriptional regulator [Actinoallomurus rhizosphaericola]